MKSLFAMSLLILGARAPAEDILVPGARVRLSTSERLLVGRLSAIGPGELTVSLADDTTAIVLARDIARAEVSVRRRQTLPGLVAGSVAGAVLAFGLHHCPPPPEPDLPPCASFGEAMGSGVVVMGAAGAAIGFLVTRESWREVGRDAWRVSLVPSRRGVALSGTVRF